MNNIERIITRACGLLITLVTIACDAIIVTQEHLSGLGIGLLIAGNAAVGVATYYIIRRSR